MTKIGRWCLGFVYSDGTPSVFLSYNTDSFANISSIFPIYFGYFELEYYIVVRIHVFLAA